MTEPTPHLGDEIQELLDGRLDPAREAAVRSHLAECDVCREHWQRLEWLKQRLRAMANSAAVPTDLDRSIRGALNRESRTEHERPSAIAPADASTASVASPPRRTWRCASWRLPRAWPHSWS